MMKHITRWTMMILAPVLLWAGTAHAQTTPQKHTVAKGETLFAVSRKYSVSVDNIKTWNQLTTDGLQVGQVLWVSNPNPTTNSQANTQNTQGNTQNTQGNTQNTQANTQGNTQNTQGNAQNPQANTQGNSQGNTQNTQDNTQNPQPVDPPAKPGVHVVKSGETLFGIARMYGMDVRDLKVLNKLEETSLKVGQTLRVKTDPAPNPNQGTPLMEMMETATKSPADSAAAKETEAFPELKVLTAAPGTMLAPDAKVTTYKDKTSGKTFKRVEEEGTVGPIEDYTTDQTKFYAFHKYLPQGSYIRIDYPQKGQSILAEVVNKLDAKDPNLLRLSAKCLDYLMIREPGAKVTIRYVLPPQ